MENIWFKENKFSYILFQRNIHQLTDSKAIQAKTLDARKERTNEHTNK